MATIKSYTDIEQSRKLAKILPIETADMFIIFTGDREIIRINDDIKNYNHWDVTPVWSLASLLSVLPNKIISHETAFDDEDAKNINEIYYKRIESNEEGRYVCCYVGNGYKYRCKADNPVDACYELILKLNELNLL